MKCGEYKFFNKSCGIACVKEKNGDLYVVFCDVFDNHQESHLGYKISTGDTPEEALENAIKFLISERKNLAQKIKQLFNSKDNSTGERVIEKEGIATYDIDTDFIDK